MLYVVLAAAIVLLMVMPAAQGRRRREERLEEMRLAINTCLAATYAAPVFTIRRCIGRSGDLLGQSSAAHS